MTLWQSYCWLATRFGLWVIWCVLYITMVIVVGSLVFPFKNLRESKDIRIQRALAFLASPGRARLLLGRQLAQHTTGFESVARD